MTKHYAGTDVNGVSATVHEVDGGVVLEHSQDIEGILKQNEAERQSTQTGGNMRKVASIPMVIYQQWDKEFQKAHGCTLMNAPKHLKQGFMTRKLNDAAFAKLRTGGGKL